MGLGPPVCHKCNLLYAYSDGGPTRWQCPKCKASLEDCEVHLWELSTEEQTTYMDNSSIFRMEQKKKKNVH